MVGGSGIVDKGQAIVDVAGDVTEGEYREEYS